MLLKMLQPVRRTGSKMKHPLLRSSLVAMNDVLLFTQYRFEATIGPLLSRKGVVAPTHTAWQHH